MGEGCRVPVSVLATNTNYCTVDQYNGAAHAKEPQHLSPHPRKTWIRVETKTFAKLARFSLY